MFGFSSSESTSEAKDARTQADGFRTLGAGGNEGALSYFNPGAPVFNFAQNESNIACKLIVSIVVVALVLSTKPGRRMLSKMKRFF